MNIPFFYPIHERPFDFYRYTEFAFKNFVENSGLELVQLDAIGGSPEVVADIFGKHLQLIPLVGIYLVSFIHFCTMTFIRTSIGSKISKETSAYFPLGYFLVVEKSP